MIRLTDEQWERIRDHFPESFSVWGIVPLDVEIGEAALLALSR
jgi:hypothetical protein